MKLSGTRSYIEVEINDKILRISGELTTTPAFYADSNSIKHWEPPFENILISESEKEELIKTILEETKNAEVKIYFD